MRNRDSNKEGSELLSKSRAWLQHYKDHQAEFEAYDNDMFGPNYSVVWDSAIGSAEKQPTDETMQDDLRDHSATVTEKAKQCELAAEELAYYARKAFKTEPEVLKEFGFNQSKRTRRREMQTALWAATARKVANDYTAELNAVAMPGNVLTDIDNAVQAAFLAELDQEYAKRMRLRATRQRRKLFHTLWLIIEDVREAAAIMYRAKPEVEGLWR